MKKILITNDDGYEAEGLKALIEAVKGLGHITVVAPATQKSACGHSLTLSKPLRFISIDDDFFKVDEGTPSDCVYLSLYALFDEKNRPDLVISGINEGSNMGEDITYSGTASAGMEAVLQGVPAISFSQVCKNGCSGKVVDYSLAKEVARDLVKKVLEGEFPIGKRKFLNVNIPPLNSSKSKGYKITKAGHRIYGNDAQINRNPRGVEYFWLGTHKLEWIGSDDKSCDLEAINEGFISITPIQLDMTAHNEIENLKKWIEK